MKAWQIGAKTGIDGLRLADHDDPVPGVGEVLVQVTAAGLNYRDLMVLEGNYGTNLPESRVPTADGVGVIEALGDGVSGWNIGQRVIAPHFLGWHDGAYSMAVFGRDLGVTGDGWLQERIVLPAGALVAVPDGMSDENAATFAVGGSTVWHAMVAFARVEPGELVLAQGTGGMAIFALQLAKAMGAQCVITSSSDEKLERCRAMGADYTINYKTRPDWAAALLEVTGGRGADVVVDTLGFGSLGETVSACATNARIGTLGGLSGTPQTQSGASQGALIGKNITIKGIASGSRAMLASALEVFARSGQRIMVDRVFAFSDAPTAFHFLKSGAHFGKVMVKI
jgi:NADPH:quinone reductase-like Zn-dependent oxidoreductase